MTEAVPGDAATKRLIAFAADVLELADRRLDLDLRQLVDDLYRDLTDKEDQ